MKLLLEGEETERLFFRRLVKSDFETWLPFHQDQRTSQFWEGLPQNPKIACQQQFDRTFERYEKGLGGMQALILKTSGYLIGLCGLLVQTVDTVQELEIGYSILPRYWRRGYAAEAAQKCKRYAFENHLADSLISIIQINNVASQEVALKNGMHRDKTTIYRNNPVHIYRITNLISN